MPQRILLLVGILAATIGGCSPQPAPPVAPKPAAPKLSGLPIEMTVGQRSTTAVPGSDGKLLLTIDDITSNQVMASLATEAGASVLSARSMAPEDAATFEFGETAYVLTLTQLNNALIGDDVAAFAISKPSDAASPTTLTENAKIEQLIAAVADLQDAKFIRNGAEYTAADAAEHLRSKWRAAGDQIKTAEQFIDAIASKSSSSGEPYLIRMADDSTVEAADYLRQRLANIED